MGHESDALLPAYRFQVTLTLHAPAPDLAAQLWDGSFAECTGLEVDADVKEYNEGGRNFGVVRRVGRAKLVPLVLKRGIFVSSQTNRADETMWAWLTRMVSGVLPMPRYDGHIEVWDAAMSRVVADWVFDRGLPAKVTGPALNAKGDIAVEELHIHDEGLRMGRP